MLCWARRQARPLRILVPRTAAFRLSHLNQPTPTDGRIMTDTCADERGTHVERRPDPWAASGPREQPIRNRFLQGTVALASRPARAGITPRHQDDLPPLRSGPGQPGGGGAGGGGEGAQRPERIERTPQLRAALYQAGLALASLDMARSRFVEPRCIEQGPSLWPPADCCQGATLILRARLRKRAAGPPATANMWSGA